MALGDKLVNLDDLKVVGDAVGDLKSAIADANKGIEALALYSPFQRGSFDEHGAVSSAAGWRAVNTDIIAFDYDTIISCPAGYMMIIAYFNGEVFDHYDSNWTTYYELPANKGFRIQITTNPQNMSVPADLTVLPYIVTKSTFIKKEIDKNADLKKSFDLITAKTKNILPNEVNHVIYRGGMATYNSGIITYNGTPSGSGVTGTGIPLTTFNLLPGNYVLSCSGINDWNKSSYYLRKVSNGDVVVSTSYVVPVDRAFTLDTATDVYLSFDSTGGVAYNLTAYIQLEYGTTSTAFVPSITAKSEIPSVIVDVNGNGQYTSLLKALKETQGDIIVRAGDYDTVDEYKDYFGNDYFTNPSSYSTSAGNFAHGLYINNRKITFEAGARVIHDLTGIDVSYAEGADRRFCAIITGMNAEIIGLNCIGTNNWYVVHDDGGVRGIAYTNKFVDCHIVGVGVVNTNAFGGGCQTKSTTIIDGCYIDNGGNSSSKTIRYHNTPYEGKPEIIVKDSYVNGCMFFGYYGEQTTKGRIMVHNCSMGSAIDVSDQASGSAENFELFDWCNVIRT